jgi:hypothetical protein
MNPNLRRSLKSLEKVISKLATDLEKQVTPSQSIVDAYYEALDNLKTVKTKIRIDEIRAHMCKLN